MKKNINNFWTEDLTTSQMFDTGLVFLLHACLKGGADIIQMVGLCASIRMGLCVQHALSRAYLQGYGR